MLGALAHGLPQLMLPQGADQFIDADAATTAGVALSLAPDEVTAGSVAASAARLLAEPGFAASAAAVRAEIDAMPDADAVLSDLSAEVTAPGP